MEEQKKKKKKCFCCSFSPSTILCCRLVELTPQFFLGNLPSSDGKELLVKLRQDTEPRYYRQDGVTDARGGARRDTDADADDQNQASTELCVVQ